MLIQSEVMNASPGVKVSSWSRYFFGSVELEPVDQPRVQDEADDDPDRERADAHEHAVAQLVEMLDERGLLAMVQAARKPWPRHPRHRS